MVNRHLGLAEPAARIATNTPLVGKVPAHLTQDASLNDEGEILPIRFGARLSEAVDRRHNLCGCRLTGGAVEPSPFIEVLGGGA